MRAVDVANGRSITFTSDGLALEGVLHLPSAHPEPALLGQSRRAAHPEESGEGGRLEGGLVVCHPHPQYGGDMRNNVVAVLCDAAVASGIAALRFNFRGVGASQGAYDNGVGEQRDVERALNYLRGLPEVDPERIALAGYSFGASLALRSAPPDLRALIAVSTPTSGRLPDLDLACPLLLVSGDRDEYSDPGALRGFAEASGPRAELVILPGVDHFWWGSDERLAAVVAGFLKHTLLAPVPNGTLTYTDS